MVDIIEPRFESFCMTNGTVPWKTHLEELLFIVHWSIGYHIGCWIWFWDYVQHFFSSVLKWRAHRC
jgi:hypothetical protein